MVAGAESGRAKTMRVTATIEPPPYTGLAATTQVDPTELRAIEGSRLTLRIDADATRVGVTHDGTQAHVDRDPRGTAVVHETLARTGYFVVDGTENNCLLIAGTKDGKVLEKIEGLSNPTAVTVDSHGAIYVGEVNGTNVKKFIRVETR